MKKGFTLIEVFIIVLIIGILSAIAIPSFIRAKEQSDKNKQAKLDSEFISKITVPPPISVKSALEIAAVGASEAFIVYKIIDNGEAEPKRFYVVVSTSSNVAQKISLEKGE